MTAGPGAPETSALAHLTSPPLATAAPHEFRPDELLHGHQEAMKLLLGGSGLPQLLDRVVLAIESAFAPAIAAVSLFEREGRALKYQAAPSLSAELLSSLGVALDTRSWDPTAACLASGERIVISRLSSDPRWPEHAALMSARGLHSCWAEPIPDCGDNLLGVATLYYPEPREPGAADESPLSALTSFVSSVVNAAQREAALRTAKDGFEALVSTIPGVVYQRIVTPEGNIRYTYISEGARDLFGVSPQEILADPEALFKIHGPDYKAKFRERLLNASKALTLWDVEATLVSPDGSKKYTHAVARPTRQEDGSVVWTGVILDETRSRGAILESLSQGVILYDAQDQLIMCNGHYLTLFPPLADVAVPGATYGEVVTCESACSEELPDLDSAAELRERLEQHKAPWSLFERQIGVEQWVLVSEQRTREGGTVVLYTDVSELKRREQQIRHLAFHDVLTGLPNRASFKQQIDNALARGRSRGTATAVISADIDSFKNVNDSLGHSAGDVVLNCLSGRLRGSVRESDMVARLGGDEFGIVLTDLDAIEYTRQIASRLLALVREPIDVGGQPIVTTLSMGIAISGVDGDDPDTLLRNAGLALYRAKADGGGKFCFFEAEMDTRAQARHALEIDLRQALAKREFELHYQPQVDIESGEILGFEALLRWFHPVRGPVPPLDFIPIAEQTGMIVELGEWVLRRACLDAMSWPPSVRVAVNVSAAQFRDAGLTERVTRILLDTGISPDRVELEITESLLLTHLETHLAVLHELKGLGLRISMDDFGTGYSSLSNLRRFPFDKIKIDRSFVVDLERNADSAAIVRAVLGLGQSLRIATCAEGVETPEQLILLRSEGCVEVQGYYFSKARPIEELPELLHEGFPRPPGVLTFID